MRVFVKICGLRTPEMVHAAVEAGADAVGFVFAESPRRVTADEAAALSAGVPPGVLRVAVMRHPDHDQCQRILEQVRPDWVQTDVTDLVGMDLAGLDLPPGVERLPVYRDVPGLDSGRWAREDRALFEAAASGAGECPDWERAAGLVQTAPRTRLVLAGGLHPGNVAAAIRQVRPWGVDVSSGVEAVRGQKDPDKIRAFIAAVRSAEQEFEC